MSVIVERLKQVLSPYLANGVVGGGELMKAIVINEYEKDFQSKLNAKLSSLANDAIVDIKFASTHERGSEKIVLHAVILHK